jgi:NAD-dependent SIR2 family protein deacetylase
VFSHRHAGLLEQVFTCNVDGLDHQLDLPVGKILAVHGTVAHVRCEFCKHKMPADEFRALVRSHIKDISASDPDAPALSKLIRCPNAKCGRAGMKPTAVLFGAKLDAAVAKRISKHLPRTDLLFVVGTSLSVKPISSIPEQCPLDAVRIVVNRDAPPSGFAFGSGRDHLLQGDCDEMFLALAARLGWLPDLARFRDEWPQASQDLFDEALAESETLESAT